jgi:glycosyltransferase involved in cell wall biosynthesis
MNSAAPKFSIVVPAYNEEQLLPRLLRSIEVARANYLGGAEAIEVVVADNDSSDGTAALAAAQGAKVVRVEKRCIGAARNGGAQIARGEILCFIDADSSIHPHTFTAIEDSLNTGKFVAGTTGLRMERHSPGLLFTWGMLMIVSYFTRIDAGVVFCKRADFEAIGGYDENRLYGEDINFLLAMRGVGRTRRQRLARLRGVRALGSTRKFDQFGDWHFLMMARQGLKSCITWNWNDEKFAARYWYDSGR